MAASEQDRVRILTREHLVPARSRPGYGDARRPGPRVGDVPVRRRPRRALWSGDETPEQAGQTGQAGQADEPAGEAPARRPRTPRDPDACDQGSMWPDPWAAHRP